MNGAPARPARRLVVLSAFCALFATTLLVGCASGPRIIDVPQQRIEAALARRFPYEARLADVFSVRVAVPRVVLLPQDNRLRLDFALDASDGGSSGGLHGDLSVSFALRYEPSDATLRLAGVRVERVDIASLPPVWRAQLQRVGRQFAERLFEGSVVHTFRSEDLARANGWTPGDIRVTGSGIQIELWPPGRAPVSNARPG